MKKRKAKLMTALFMSIICMTALAPKVKASAVSSGEFPVTIDVGDSLGYDDKEFEIELKAEHPDNPMPEDSENGVYTIKITGPTTSTFPKIDFSEVGTYTYTISQKFDGDESEEYDTKVFLLKVQVTRSSFTNLLQAASTMYVLGQDAKVAGAVFYNAPPPIPTEPTEEASEEPTQAPTQAPTQPPTQAPTGVLGATMPPPADSPRTGDENNIIPYFVLFASGAGMIILLGLSTISKSRKLLKD
ncbi:MAG: hypothetical protein GX995_08580 [Clostridiales bacterium]|nr:hypothetical protein [Clostridiales bacterium]